MAEGTITSEEYMEKLDHFIVSRTQGVLNQKSTVESCANFLTRTAVFYRKTSAAERKTGREETRCGHRKEREEGDGKKWKIRWKPAELKTYTI